MKTYKLFTYLFTLLLATAQATQQDFNENNTNEHSYTHGGEENWIEIVKKVKYKGLQKPLIKLYEDGIARPTGHIRQTLPVYFVVGPKGAGKSTFIFALQGNSVTKRRQQGFYSDDSDDSDDDGSQLIMTNTIGALPTPKVAISNYATTKGVKVFYTGRRGIDKPMAFCDTEGALGKREENVTPEEKALGAFSPCFALKANKIGGIIFLVSKDDIGSVGGESFCKSMEFLKDYFDLAVTDDNLSTLKKSVILLINKVEDERSTGKQFAKIVKDTYKKFYNNTTQNQDGVDGNLKRFFSLFLKDDSNINKDNVENTKFRKLIDREKMKFFYPYKQDIVKNTREALAKLTVLDTKYLSKKDDPISQKLIQEIINRAYDINQEVHKALQPKHLAQLQSLVLEKRDNNVISSKLKERKKQLEKTNDTIMYNEMLEPIFDEQHTESANRTDTSSTKNINNKFQEQKFILINEGLVEGKGYFKNSSWFSRTVNRVINVIRLPYTSYMAKQGKYVYQGHLYKRFIYEGGRLVYSIKIVENKDGEVSWRKPSQDFILQHFNSKVQGNTTTLTSTGNQGIRCDTWDVYHGTPHGKDADFYIKFFSKKNYLQESEWKIKDNKNTIQRIDNLLKENQTSSNKNNQDLKQECNKNKGIANNHIQKLRDLQKEMEMISCWSNYIFKKVSTNQQLIAQYRDNYNEAITPINQLSINNNNHNRNQIISPILGITGILASLLQQN